MNVVPHKASAQSSQSGAGGGTEWPPSWNTMPHGISVGRYVDPDFQKLEYAKLWSKVCPSVLLRAPVSQRAGRSPF
jgi:hypothetical protein